ncbi:MAG: tyrosine-type recombinase/integrase [Ghiorsea sp.]
MKITKDAQIKALPLPEDNTKQKHSAGEGLTLVCRKSGKSWFYYYTYNGKRREIGLGTFRVGDSRHVGLKAARALLAKTKALLEDKIDPKQHREEKKREESQQKTQIEDEQKAAANTFELVARKWYKAKKDEWVETHAVTIIRRLEAYVFPRIGSVPIANLKKADVSEVIEAIADSDKKETAKRVAIVIRQVLDTAYDKGLIQSIPIGKISNLVGAVSVKNYPALTDPKSVGALLRDIEAYKGNFVTKQAFKLLPLFALRSGELRAIRWEHVDFNKAEITIPAENLKQKKKDKANKENSLAVPLSRQALEALEALHGFTGGGDYLFPQSNDPTKTMSENTINKALHKMGYKGKMTGHGFRATFSTLLNEQNYNSDAIEKQLSHVGMDKVRAAYHRGQHMEGRVVIMQKWADYLDGLRDGAQVIPINQKSA